MKKKSISLIALILALAMVMCLTLAACGGDSAGGDATDNPGTDTPTTDTPATEQPSQAPADPSGGEDEASPFEIFQYDLPNGYKAPTDNPGEIHEETYTTYKYDNDGNKGEAIEATLYVYTPAGYDAGKQYNIIYLMHGIGDYEGYWLGAGPYAEGGERYNKAQQKYTTNVFEHMIADGRCDEAILVTPTFMNQFSDDENDPDYVYGEDSTAKLIRMSYEFKNDIIPFVEAKYSTYAGGDVSDANLIASRDHRAYAGLSMGSMTGFQAIWMNCVEYFAYIGNFSGCDAQGTGIAAKVAETLNTKYAEYDIKYWYNGNGTSDSLHDDHVEGYDIITTQCADKFTEGEDYANGQNCIFVDKPGKGHAYNSWIVDFYNVMSVFFKAS